jgi:NAD(P)-dependent dehydrogenase (short-subunit alcohol dehydrogenase family)
MPLFANRIALITGAGSGLGRQLALTLAEEGAAIAAIDLQAEPLAALESELKGKLVACAVADVTERAALHPAVAELRQRLGPIDLLIANAGIGIETSALAYRAADIEAQIRVNLIGVVNSIDAVLPEMIERKQGQIVAISSLASYRGLPRMAGYCASKAGVNALLDALRVELQPLGLSVTTICPGWIRTPLTANIAVPHPHMMEVADAARQIAAAIHQRRRFFAFPRPMVRQLRWLRWLPCGLSDWLTIRGMQRFAKS